MALSINVNVPSLNAQRNLNRSQGALSTSLQRLSSGLRLNSAKDDAAGMAIATRFTSQIRGLNQAARNANDGISLAQTAEGALEETVNNLQRLRELSIQSANATNSASDRASLQAEVKELVAEITRVGNQTAFNGTTMLDGSFSTQKFQIGANANQTISIASISDARSTALGSQTMTLDGTVTGGTMVPAADVSVNTIAAETDLTLTTVDGGTTTAISYAVNAGADGVATAINTAAGSIGITATATNTAELKSMGSTGNITMTLNGSAISATVTNTGDLTSVMSSINGKTGATGITASFTSSTAKDSLTLTTSDGRDIKVLDFTHDGATTTVDFAGALLDGVIGSQDLALDGTSMGATTTPAADLTGGNGVAVETDLTLTTATGGTTTAISYAAGAGADAIATAINGAAGTTGITATAAANTADLTLAATGTIAMSVNGVTITPVVIADIADLSALATEINSIAGLTATDATGTLTITATDGRNITIENFSDTATTGNQTMTFDGKTLTEGGNDSAIKTSTVSLSSSKGTISFANSDTAVFNTTANTTVGASLTDSSIKVGTVELSSSQGQITSANAAADVFAAAGTNTSTLSAVSAMDISTDTGAQSAITVIDAALSMVNSIRGSLGAIQNRFSSTVASIQTTSENLSASRSRIQDTDFAAETAALTRGQILQQAGIAMLSQANSLPQAVLSLLQ